MSPTLRRWLDRVDREHIHAFARFLWTRFLDDRCFETAGALSYTTLFALVPLSMVVFGILVSVPQDPFLEVGARVAVAIPHMDGHATLTLRGNVVRVEHHADDVRVAINLE